MDPIKLQNASLLSKVLTILSLRESVKVDSMSRIWRPAAPAYSLTLFLLPLLLY